MPSFILPDGNALACDQADGLAIATAISPGLARQALAIEVDGVLQDLTGVVPDGAQVRIVTARDDDPQALSLLRHSAAHLMAAAVCELFPGTRLAYGPATADGFFYDMALPRVLTPEDFPAITARMQDLVARDLPFVREDCSPAAGLERVAGDQYKTDNAQRAVAAGAQSLSFYRLGEAFEDLCAGPHVPSTRFLAHCQVMSVAGAYWHGDQDSDQLTRLYGTAFASKKGLAAYLRQLEEAKERDHRRIGREMDLFHIEEDNPGQIYWHPRGWTLYRTIENHLRQAITAEGYVEVRTPALQPQGLWERSGHWDKYRENMFITYEQDRGVDRSAAGEHGPAQAQPEPGAAPAGPNRCFSIKPMNCPGHIAIFKQGLKSYRDLPLRMAEFGPCVRYEPSGALHGIMRVRGFVQDDGHIYCTEEQIGDEVGEFCRLLKQIYADFGFPPETVKVKFSTRPEKRVGSDADWDRAEAALEAAVRQAGLEVSINPGEGAFYGPKLEFVLTDCLGRDWQCGTIQVDYQLCSAERLNATYVAADGSKRHPILLHRAICGSFERFIGILIEHYAGKLPLWLAPEQIRVLAISDAHIDYGRQVVGRLLAAGLRATLDTDADKLGAKIRRARNDRVTYFAVVGAQEAETGTVSLQRQNGDKLGQLDCAALISRLQDEVSARTAPSQEA